MPTIDPNQVLLDYDNQPMREAVQEVDNTITLRPFTLKQAILRCLAHEDQELRTTPEEKMSAAILGLELSSKPSVQIVQPEMLTFIKQRAAKIYPPITYYRIMQALGLTPESPKEDASNVEGVSSPE